MLIAIAVFVVTGAIVVVAGTALARYGDAISEATGIGRVWIGTVLLAAATSLPELATDIAAVRLDAPDLAAGDLFGSSLSNMLILAVIDLLPPRGRVLRPTALAHALSACMAMVLNALAGVLLLVRLGRPFLWIGPSSVVLLLAYLAGARVVYRHTAAATAEATAEPRKAAAEVAPTRSVPRGMPLRRAVVGFALASLAILAAAPAFAWSAKRIAELTGLGATFVGTWLVGLATSLPELVASVAAVRMGVFDLAVGNLYGSNAFNMLVFFPLDVAYTQGPLFAALSPDHVISALFAVILMALGLAAIVYRAERKFLMLEPSSLLMILVYGLAIWLLYLNAAVG